MIESDVELGGNDLLDLDSEHNDDDFESDLPSDSEDIDDESDVELDGNDLLDLDSERNDDDFESDLLSDS